MQIHIQKLSKVCDKFEIVATLEYPAVPYPYPIVLSIVDLHAK